METSSSSLIIIEMMDESRRRETDSNNNNNNNNYYYYHYKFLVPTNLNKIQNSRLQPAITIYTVLAFSMDCLFQLGAQTCYQPATVAEN